MQANLNIHMFCFHIIRELGTGIRNVFKYSKAYSGSDRVVFSEEDVFITQIPLMNSVRENVSFENPEKTVEKTVEKIIVLLVQNPEITQNKLQVATRLSRRGVEWNIQKIKTRGIIERIEPNNGGYWKVNID